MTVVDEPLEAAAPDLPSARPVTTPARFWRDVRGPATVVLLILVAAALLAALVGPVRGGALYPDSARPPGGRALAQLLQDRGVAVERTPRFSGRAGQTVFVPAPALLSMTTLRDLATTSGTMDLVLVAPEDEQLELLGIDGARVARESVVDKRAPRCSLPEAVTAGRADAGGLLFATDGAVAECYPDGGTPSLVVLQRGATRIVLVGAAEPFMNGNLDEQGNAALALGLLSRHPRVEWLQPRLSELGELGQRGGEGAPLITLVPRGVRWAMLQLFLAALVAALWRGRRLGPPVTEPLPVAVRAAEAVEGRARLYLAAKARERAATSLRAAVRTRLARALGLPVDADRETLVPAIAARSRNDPGTVDLILYGPPPPNDAELVGLADRLDSLDSEVRHT